MAVLNKKEGIKIEELTTSVILSGTDKTKQGAFINAIGKLQNQLSSSINGLPIRIEPISVKVIEGKEFIHTEKFLFLFMKRKVSKFSIKIEVKVRAIFVNIDKFQFEREEIKTGIL